ncbi:MAG: hypothetical protein A3H97_25035 [Acidobacteria bacterium RIFCSPLOWO2_02_FULL_65_29]|nr:MAG: hypothetical protein A3H97_25035 [Acidobacteria bacterium RIFCSPLOWO2_02_FULL_65_29]
MAADEFGHLDRRHQALGKSPGEVGLSAANCASVAVSTGSGYAFFLMAPPPSSGADEAFDAE